MKKIVLASVMALASVSMIATPVLRAQDSITIKDPAEFNAYQVATTQSDPHAKASAMEDFLMHYPQSVVKNAVLTELIRTYQQLGDADKTLSAASRMLQVDPNNMEAIVISVFLKKAQCAKTSDAQTCDDAAALAQKGLQVPKPADLADDKWKAQIAVAYPAFHSAMALDDEIKKDYKGAQAEYKAELMLYSDAQSQSAGLGDSLLLAQAYSQPGSAQDLIQAVWFYARVWDFAPANYKAQIEPKLEYYYKKYHGGLDGLDAIKQQAMASTFPPGTFAISKAKSPAEQIHDLIAATPDLNTLALEDKETVLALGSKDDADKMWAELKDKQTQVPGTVIEATASQIKIAVTEDAKASKVPDFIVNLKTPLTDAELKLYQPGFEFKTQPAAELDGTYDTYTQMAATDTTAQSAQIVLRDGAVIPEVKKRPVHKPAAAHHAAQK
ncbi:MAG TPA: hypothetical protein VE291_00180 [Terracidiphilus sp.]|jgi:tetratricopeptide (TPR) repeat protein|nr:hypothetical protein [Terracidiphilus sp.]